MKPDTSKWLNALQLMRIPFSLFLMPVYWFALLNIEVNFIRSILVFIILHLVVYPASNGYNSYFDKDEQSIGGLKKPPQVTRELWHVVIAFDLLAVLLSLTVNLPFTIMVFIYLLVSKAYSYDKIRLKKYPVTGALTVIFFQGFFTYFCVQAGAGGSFVFTTENFGFGVISSLFLLGSYPMTQIYQHEEDSLHNDFTLSRMLGIKGTFIFTGIIFFFASVLLCYLFYRNHSATNIIIYLLAMLPVNAYFIKWFFDYLKGKEVITYERTMMLNQLSSSLLSIAFVLMLLLR